MTNLQQSCTCQDRSWFGPYHDTQCPRRHGRTAEGVIAEVNDFADAVERVALRIIASPCHLGTREDAFILAREAVEEIRQ